MNVQITSQETLKPSLPTPTHLRYHQISLLDQLNSPFFVPTVYFFNRPPNTTHLDTQSFLHKLKTALSVTLSIYYPLAGRLQTNANYVTCNDQGVPYLHAQVGSTTKALSPYLNDEALSVEVGSTRKTLGPCLIVEALSVEVGPTSLSDVVRKVQISDLDQLIPTLNDQNSFSRILLGIQINTFSCGGVAIGVKSNHRVTDGFSLLMFLNAWADITNGKDPNSLPRPNFDTAKLFPPICNNNPIDNVLDDPNPHLLVEKPVAKWFMFSREKLIGLRSSFLSTSSQKSSSVPSPASILSAFIWSRIILSWYNNNNKPYEVFVPVHIGPKVNIPSNNSFYYGNMFINAIAKPSCTLNDGTSLCHDYLERVRHSVKNIITDGNLVREIQEGKKDLKFVTDQFNRVKKGEIIALGFSHVPSLEVVEPDFGWGDPVWAMTGTMVDGLILISRAGPYSKDLIATINMNKEDMIKLEGDDVFNSLVYKKASLLDNISKL